MRRNYFAEADEESCQIVFVNWVNCNFPELSKSLHHSPNGGHRHVSVAKKLKRMGTKAGFPDLVLYHRLGSYVGLVIEMKHGKNKPTASQNAWMETLDGVGFMIRVCWTLDEAKAVWREYMELAT